jgi:hypothetical protein
MPDISDYARQQWLELVLTADAPSECRIQFFPVIKKDVHEWWSSPF